MKTARPSFLTGECGLFLPLFRFKTAENRRKSKKIEENTPINRKKSQKGIDKTGPLCYTCHCSIRMI